jgi:hypothetical protein
MCFKVFHHVIASVVSKNLVSFLLILVGKSTTKISDKTTRNSLFKWHGLFIQIALAVLFK